MSYLLDVNYPAGSYQSAWLSFDRETKDLLLKYTHRNNDIVGHFSMSLDKLEKGLIELTGKDDLFEFGLTPTCKIWNIQAYSKEWICIYDKSFSTMSGIAIEKHSLNIVIQSIKSILAKPAESSALEKKYLLLEQMKAIVE